MLTVYTMSNLKGKRHCGSDLCKALQVVLTVDVVRVGTYALLPNASMTSRSLIPLQGDVSENEELMKMSGLMIYVSPCQPSTTVRRLCAVLLQTFQIECRS